MDSGIIKVGTCQFAVTNDIEHNSKLIQKFIGDSSEGGADIVHFSECALSGYASVDFENFEGFEWELLREETRKIMALAGERQIWVVLGSCHELTAPNKPHNSLYLIGPEGEIHDRYDKRFGTETDLGNYTPGNRFVYFDINGVKCSLLICFDLRFPELYRALCREKVQCIFQSFYNARQKGPSVHSDIMQQSMQCRAATNYFWVSMTNSCGWYCPYPGCFIRPDGRIVEQLEDHKDGMIINTVDTNELLYDPSRPFRKAAIDGALGNGLGEVDDPRSTDTKTI
jgi:predicted amidohydrolase